MFRRARAPLGAFDSDWLAGKQEREPFRVPLFFDRRVPPQSCSLLIGLEAGLCFSLFAASLLGKNAGSFSASCPRTMAWRHIRGVPGALVTARLLGWGRGRSLLTSRGGAPSHGPSPTPLRSLESRPTALSRCHWCPLQWEPERACGAAPASPSLPSRGPGRIFPPRTRGF